ATTTSASGAGGRWQAGRPGRRTGAGSRCRSTGSAPTGVGGGVAGGARPPPARAGQHGQGHPAVPAAPSADLVLDQAAQSLGGLEGFLQGQLGAFDTWLAAVIGGTRPCGRIRAATSTWRCAPSRLSARWPAGLPRSGGRGGGRTWRAGGGRG